MLSWQLPLVKTHVAEIKFWSPLSLLLKRLFGEEWPDCKNRAPASRQIVNSHQRQSVSFCYSFHCAFNDPWFLDHPQRRGKPGNGRCKRVSLQVTFKSSSAVLRPCPVSVLSLRLTIINSRDIILLYDIILRFVTMYNRCQSNLPLPAFG